MVDQHYVVGYQTDDKLHTIQVDASSVTLIGEKEDSYWKIVGDKGTLIVSARSFLYAFPASMHHKA
jgi:hypothetical protein